MCNSYHQSEKFKDEVQSYMERVYETCPICLEYMTYDYSFDMTLDDFLVQKETTITDCGHVFHLDCLARSIVAKGKNDCPICRRENCLSLILKISIDDSRHPIICGNSNLTFYCHQPFLFEMVIYMALYDIKKYIEREYNYLSLIDKVRIITNSLGHQKVKKFFNNRYVISIHAGLHQFYYDRQMTIDRSVRSFLNTLSIRHHSKPYITQLWTRGNPFYGNNDRIQRYHRVGTYASRGHIYIFPMINAYNECSFLLKCYRDGTVHKINMRAQFHNSIDEYQTEDCRVMDILVSNQSDQSDQSGQSGQSDQSDRDFLLVSPLKEMDTEKVIDSLFC